MLAAAAGGPAADWCERFGGRADERGEPKARGAANACRFVTKSRRRFAAALERDGLVRGARRCGLPNNLSHCRSQRLARAHAGKSRATGVQDTTTVAWDIGLPLVPRSGSLTNYDKTPAETTVVLSYARTVHSRTRSLCHEAIEHSQ